MPAPGLMPHPISALDPRIQWVGRVAHSSSGVRLFWSGSGFVVTMSGTGLDVTIDDPNNRFTLLIDGQVVLPSCGPFASGARTLARGLPPGEHTVSLLRRSEPVFGETLVTSLAVHEGEPLPCRPAPDQIEVLGDSISCGYGNEAEHTDVPFSVHTENHYHSYASLLGRSLGVPVSTIAWSGRGVIRNHADDPSALMPVLYERALPLENDATAWHFRDPTQLVLIHLGTNDFGSPPRADAALFVDGYVRLLQTVRQRRPGTPILCTLGPMLDPPWLTRAQGYVSQAVERRRAAGDTAVHSYPITAPNHDPGTNTHPSVRTHELMAAELLPVVRRILGRNAT